MGVLEINIQFSEKCAHLLILKKRHIDMSLQKGTFVLTNIYLVYNAWSLY